MEAYLDDMIVKSQQEKDHVGDLRETFETLRKFKLRLNPKKCVLGVLAGKFLGPGGSEGNRSKSLRDPTNSRHEVSVQD